ncbi:dipeptidyl peptidase III [Aspergillus venezuelensis]
MCCYQLSLPSPQIFQLSVATGFNKLNPTQELYAHHLARYPPEENPIFDFVMALYTSCNGDWDDLATRAALDDSDLQLLLEYAATFLSNVGNYYGSGDQKFIPAIAEEKLGELATYASPDVGALWTQIAKPMYQMPPLSLGFPGELTQSAYYLGFEGGEESSLRMEAALVSKEVLSILQASVTESTTLYKGKNSADAEPGKKTIQIVTGDHKDELAQIKAHLDQALKYVSNHAQHDMINKLQEKSQSIWVRDRAPAVESIFGFVEPYRDPLGVRSEFEGIVGIPDSRETETLNTLSEQANEFVCRLPWLTDDSGSRGPFEKSRFEVPDFSSVQNLVYCSSIIFPGINLPNYNDIRQETGYKNIIFSNRMLAESHRERGAWMISESEISTFKQHLPHAYYIWVVLHEILGHGTGRFLTEASQGIFNFDRDRPPLDPTTGEPVKSWYQPGQTWTGVFGDLATTVDECRAELVGAYSIDDEDILGLFGVTEYGDVTPDDRKEPRNQQSLIPDTKHDLTMYQQAHYSILRHLLRDTKILYTITCTPQSSILTVSVNRSLIRTEGKPSLARMLLCLHIYRCTADIARCRQFYEDLSSVDEEALKWREVVMSRKDPPLVFSQANTFFSDAIVELREYEATPRGVIQSWVEREV